MTCPVCGVRREAFAEDGSWYAHLSYHLPVRRSLPVVPRFPKPLSKRQQREQERLAQKRREQLRRMKERQYAREWRANHPGLSAEYSRRYRECHPGVAAASNKRWREHLSPARYEEYLLYKRLYHRDHADEEREYNRDVAAGAS